MRSSLARRARALTRTPAWRTGALRAPVARRAGACGAAALLACAPRSTTRSADSATGRYALARYQGLAVPADLGISGPYRGGTVGRACHILVTGGTLTLDIPGGRFAYGYDVRDGCSPALVEQPCLAGLVTQRGAALTFRIPRFIGTTPLDTITFAGTWASGVVTIDPGGTEALVYRRRPGYGRAGEDGCSSPRRAEQQRRPSPSPARVLRPIAPGRAATLERMPAPPATLQHAPAAPPTAPALG